MSAAERLGRIAEHVPGRATLELSPDGWRATAGAHESGWHSSPDRAVDTLADRVARALSAESDAALVRAADLARAAAILRRG